MPAFTRVVVACDHAAVAARARVVELLKASAAEGVEVVDCGPHTCDRVDYPDKAAEVCAKVAEAPERSCGVLLCGSGIGMSIAACKVDGIRAALCHDHYTATMCRRHNNANVLCMGARTTGPDVIAEMLQAFLATGFEGGRHEGRVGKIMAPKAALPAPAAEASKTLVLGCDHAAWEEKALVAKFVEEKGWKVVDCGVSGPDRVDYPDVAGAVCAEVAKTGGRGILICGSGIGMAITANKFNGIRAALCHEAYTARMCRNHNDANVMCMGARTSGPEMHKEMVSAFLSAEFEGGRHADRVAKITALETSKL